MMPSRTKKAFDVLKPREGCVLERVDLTPRRPEYLVVQLRRPGGSTSWVALCGAFDLGLSAVELQDGDRLIRQVLAGAR